MPSGRGRTDRYLTKCFSHKTDGHLPHNVASSTPTGVCMPPKDSQMADLALCIHSSPAILEWTHKMDMRPHCAPHSTSREPPCYNMVSDSSIFHLAIHCRARTSPWPPSSNVPVFLSDPSTLYECFTHIQRMATKNQSDRKK